MPRLIDAEALDAKLEKLMRRYAKQGRERVAEDYNFVRTVLSTGPTIDPESLRPHGRWEKSEDGYCGLALLECSLCRGECFDIDEDIELVNYRYCPNCGAKMDLEEEDK